MAVRWLDGRDDPVARHHTLGGRRLSAIDTERLGLPVVPFTVMAEMLAQAAAVLVPGKVVIGLRDVQANRWLAYGEDGPVALEVRADREPDRNEVRVAIRNRGARGDDPTVAGIVVFGDRRAAGPEAPAFEVPDGGRCRFTAEELYRDQWLFHGPALQALTRVGASSPGGIEGTLHVLPRRDLFPERQWPVLHTDPIVLDAFTHLLGCWGLDKQAGEEGDVIFPLRLASLSVFGVDPPEGSAVDCRIRVNEVTRHRVKVDATLVGPDGRVWMALDGWEDWRFYWPDRYRDVLRSPSTVFLGERVELPGSDLMAVWLEPPADMAKPVWGDVLEWVQLSPEERAANRALGEAEPAALAADLGPRRRQGGRAPALARPRRAARLSGRPGDRARCARTAAPGCRSLIEGGAARPSRSPGGRRGSFLRPGLDPEAWPGVAIERSGSRPRFAPQIAFSERERGWLDPEHPDLDRDEWTRPVLVAKKPPRGESGQQTAATPAIADADRESGELAIALNGPTQPIACRSSRFVTGTRGGSIASGLSRW